MKRWTVVIFRPFLEFPSWDDEEGLTWNTGSSRKLLDTIIKNITNLYIYIYIYIYI
jgi:hypothetical protein